MRKTEGKKIGQVCNDISPHIASSLPATTEQNITIRSEHCKECQEWQEWALQWVPGGDLPAYLKGQHLYPSDIVKKRGKHKEAGLTGLHKSQNAKTWMFSFVLCLDIKNVYVYVDIDKMCTAGEQIMYHTTSVAHLLSGWLIG